MLRSNRRRYRRNKGAPTAAEQRSYASGWERTFGKKKRKKSAAKKSAPKSAAKRGGSAKSTRALKREHVYRAAVKKGLSSEKAARKAMRAVPYEKGARGRTYKGVKVYTGKGGKRKARKKTKLPRQYATVRTTRRVKKRVTVSVKRKTRVAYGRYKRARVRDPRTGKSRLSYYYRAKGKKGRKKIPSWAIAGAKSPRDYKDSKYDKERERIRKRRAAAARRVERGGNAFVPNRSRSKKTMARKKRSRKRSRSTKRSLAAKRGWRRRKARAAAKAPARRRRRKKSGKKRYKANRRRARRTVGKGRGKLGVRLKRGKVYYKGRKPRSLRGRRRGVRRLPKARIYLTNRRRRATGEYFTANRRRKRPKTMVANRRRRRKGGRRKLARGGRYTANRRRSRRKYRGNRRYTRNAWFADLKTLLKGALFGGAGFVAHKVLTRLLVDKVVLPMLTKSSEPTPAPASGFGATDFKAQAAKFAPILVGLLTAGGLVLATGKLVPKRRNEIGMGVIVSLVHTGILTALGMSTSKGASDAAKMIAGYDTSSTAAAIGRYRRNRGMRGLRGLGGGGAPQQSIMPRYAPTGRPGGIQQAVAGRLRGTGEYFQTSGMGEYFASGVQGIGAYEMAGPLVTQAAAGMGQVIDDGIRPDCNLDQVLTLAEAQAGTNGYSGLGEYYSARKDGDMFSVPQRSEWIPGDSAPELWAGTKSANDPSDVSEIPAGILETAGGNGIFG